MAATKNPGEFYNLTCLWILDNATDWDYLEDSDPNVVSPYRYLNGEKMSTRDILRFGLYCLRNDKELITVTPAKFKLGQLEKDRFIELSPKSYWKGSVERRIYHIRPKGIEALKGNRDRLDAKYTGHVLANKPSQDKRLLKMYMRMKQAGLTGEPKLAAT